MGLTFKEDCPDLRNSRVIDVIKECRTWGIDPLVHDPLADSAEAQYEYGVELVADEAIKNIDALIFTVAHAPYKQWSTDQVIARLAPGGSVFDVKGMLSREAFAQAGTILWRM